MIKRLTRIDRSEDDNSRCKYADYKVNIWFALGLLLLIIFLSQSQALALNKSFQGQLSGWVTGNENDGLIAQTGFRYIPELFLEKSVGESLTLDFELSANIFGSLDIHDKESNQTEVKIKKYRLWGRIAGDRFETRIGLQKINFGSATLFRPLRWFDRIDPRDPLKLTKGVYGLLMRNFFQNNVNIWLWGLYGNDDAKGQEIAPAKKDTPEFGGRLQIPLYTGEMGITYHHRKADFSKLSLPFKISTQDSSVEEDRLGFDGKWDIGVGVWFEGSFSRHQTEVSYLKYQQALTIGMDYTFNIGNGLNIIGEYYLSGIGDSFFDPERHSDFLGLSLNYPIGLFDNLSSIVYYDVDNKDWYHTVTWQRLFDNWSLFMIGFWNPKEQVLKQSFNNNFFGKGFHILVVFNH